jgi:hypothetical protein
MQAGNLLIEIRPNFAAEAYSTALPPGLREQQERLRAKLAQQR